MNKVLLTPSRPAEGASAQDHKPTLPIYNSHLKIAFTEVNPVSTQSQTSPHENKVVQKLLGQLETQKQKLARLQEHNQDLIAENKRLQEHGHPKVQATDPPIVGQPAAVTSSTSHGDNTPSSL